MNKEDNIGTDIFTIQGRMITAIADTRDKQTIKEIKEYFKNKYKNEYVDIALLDEKKSRRNNTSGHFRVQKEA